MQMGLQNQAQTKGNHRVVQSSFRDLSQIEGIDYRETFSLIAKLVTIYLFLSVTALHQIDMNHVVLHGDLAKDVYETLAPGLV